MAGPLAPRRRSLPELFSVLIVYALIALGAYAFAASVLVGAPSFPDLYERLPVALLAVPHDHADAVEPNRVERVFVGEVVADVDRQQGTCFVDVIADPGQHGALFPVDVRPQFD